MATSGIGTVAPGTPPPVGTQDYLDYLAAQDRADDLYLDDKQDYFVIEQMLNDDDSLPPGQVFDHGGNVDWLLQQMIAGKIPAFAVREILTRSETLRLQPATASKNFASALGYVNAVITARNFSKGAPYRFAFQNYEDIERPIQFYSPRWNENKDTGMVVLPVPPETMEISGSNAPEEVVAASGVTFSHAGPYAPLTFSLEGFFPYLTDVKNLPGYVPTDTLTKGIYSPAALTHKFTEAMRAGQPLKFSVVDPLTPKKLMQSYNVVVTDFNWSFRFGHGQDRFWTMTLREWFPQKMILTGRKVKKGSQGNQRPGPPRPAPGTNRTHTVVPNDSLWKLADKYLANHQRWREIYDLNEVVIEARAKRAGRPNSANNGVRGWWIYPGTVLKIPA